MHPPSFFLDIFGSICPASTLPFPFSFHPSSLPSLPPLLLCPSLRSGQIEPKRSKKKLGGCIKIKRGGQLVAPQTFPCESISFHSQPCGLCLSPSFAPNFFVESAWRLYRSVFLKTRSNRESISAITRPALRHIPPPPSAAIRPTFRCTLSPCGCSIFTPL